MALGPPGDDGSSDDANTPLQSPRSQNTSREEDDSSNANESDCKSSSQRYDITKSNQRWMKLRTTVQISSAMQKKPPLKREDSFLKRFSTRQIPETQETVEDTGSEGNAGDSQSAPRRRRRYRKQPRTVVNPDENFYFYWLLVLTVCVLYNMWTLIVRESFPELQNMISGFWLACDCVSDVVFLLDVGVQLRTGHLEQGLMVYDSRKLACHYLRSRAFILDLAALAPLDLLQLKIGTHPLLRCPRFLKVYRAVNYYYMVESRTIWPNLWRVINLIHILLILAHWFGCFYFLLSEAEGFQGDWVYPYRPGDYATLTRKYLGSLYWSTLTLTTIGDLPTPETNAEDMGSVDGPRSLPRRGVKSRLLQFNTNHGYIFTIVSYLIGVFIFATIVGQVGNVITNRNANRLEFERLLDGAKTYMRHHKVPGGMKRRVLRWYDYSWSRGRIQGGGDINTALGLLPDKLKTELALHVNLSVLKKVTIFQECQPEFLRDLVLKMKAYIFTPGDSICRKGEVAREMFIIADGILEVLSENGKVLTTMKAGDFFGEIGILNLDGLNKRTADVRSVGYSELFSLSREDVLAAMKDYPEAQEILQALGRKRLMEVKASARHPPHHKEHHHGGAHPDPKGIVDKIKNEAKGLRNALKKTRTHRRSEESLELQPLQPNNSNTKGTLKRMSRVKSHDLSQEDVERKEQPKPTSEPVTSPLGAGLPLLHRLRLLKEKQENEERAKSATPPMLSPSATSMKSPPSVAEDGTIGAGLPLLQRILLLKAKEDKAAAAARAARPAGRLSFVGQAAAALTREKSGSQPTSPTPVGEKQPVAARASFSGVGAPRASLAAGAAAGRAAVAQLLSKPVANKISFRERLKLHTCAKLEPSKDATIKEGQVMETTPTGATSPITPPPATAAAAAALTTAAAAAAATTTATTTTAATTTATTTATATTTTTQQQPNVEPSSTSDSVNKTTVPSEHKQKQTGGQASSDRPGGEFRSGRPSDPSRHSQAIDDGLRSGRSNGRPDGEAAAPSGEGKEPISASDSLTSESDRNEAPWSKLKKAAISRDTSDPPCATPPRDGDSVATAKDKEAESAATPPVKKVKPSLVLNRRTKQYRSIDDLSPEYGPLPFVKKLKILNERQKLEELETAIKTRSFSLDIPDSSQQSADAAVDTLTRSRSEGSAVHGQGGAGGLLPAPLAPSPLHSSTESNETPERRNLKSILKKLSEDTQQQQQQQQPQQPPPQRPPSMPEKEDSTEFRKLMRAPTIEGDTLQSPPNSATLQGIQPQPLFPFGTVPTDNGIEALEDARRAKHQELDKILPNKSNHQMKFLKGTLDDDQQYFADILLAIKQVMTSHLQEMQEKFQNRFEKLEEEVRSRDEIINQLKAHICELERSTDDYSFSDSMETVISAGRGNQHSWEEPSNIESEELQEIPHHPLTPQHVWSPTSENVAVDMLDSATDTDSDLGDSSEQEQGGYESAEYENSSSNWEIELLAQQIRQRRSASLDHSAGKPPGRRRLTRGSSADARND